MTPGVLIVDDSLTVRMDLAQAFETAGFRVRVCASAAEAREVMARDPLDVAVLDVLLPDANGIDLLEELRTLSPRDIVVLLLSSESAVADRIRGLRRGADEYVGKPYDLGYVVSRTRALLKERWEPGETSPIILIEDSRTYREMLGNALEAEGYSVLRTESGEEGLQQAAAIRPSAFIVDGVLPGIDGTTVLRRIRLDAALRGVPCILLTAKQDVEIELSALDSGADGFVRKDEDLDVVLAKVRAILRGASDARTGASLVSLLEPKRILAVDDSATYRQELSLVLRNEGYDVICACSGEEAIELLPVQPVDCILLDLVMPGMGGQETCQYLKASPTFRDIPLIVLTGVEDREVMIQGLTRGADDYIQKSADFAVLKARVRVQLRRRQFEEETRRVREQLLRREMEASEARAARELAETRAELIMALEQKNRELSDLAQKRAELAEEFQRANTALEAAYAELQETQSQLVQSAKMASLGQLVAGVAHEINNPLAFVISHLNTASRSLSQWRAELGPDATSDKWDRAWSRLQEMNAGLLRIRDLVVKLRTFSRLDEDEYKLVNIRECVDSVLTILGHRLKNRIQIETHFEPPDFIECYPSLLNQGVMNLVVNAIDAIEGEGWIQLTAKGDGDDYVLTVTDSGCGIPEALHSRVLEPFFTTKPVGEGTGLGLSITYSIVQKHGGKLTLAASEGRGTRATIRLPLKRP